MKIRLFARRFFSQCICVWLNFVYVLQTSHFQNYSLSQVQNRNREGTLAKVSVADLKLYCQGVRLKVPSSAKKGDLVDAVKKFLG